MNIVLAAFLIFNLPNQQPSKFRSVSDSLRSPDGRYSVYVVVSEKDSQYRQELVLKDRLSERNEVLLQFRRDVTVIWSPDSKSIAITDYAGSNYSDCKVFVLGEITRIISIQSELKNKYGANRHLFGNHHVYIEAKEWKNADSLKIHIDGYGEIDPDGFDLDYILDLRSGVYPCSH